MFLFLTLKTESPFKFDPGRSYHMFTFILFIVRIFESFISLREFINLGMFNWLKIY